MLQEIKFDEYTTVVVDCNEKLEHDDLFCILNEYELDRIKTNFEALINAKLPRKN